MSTKAASPRAVAIKPSRLVVALGPVLARPLPEAALDAAGAVDKTLSVAHPGGAGWIAPARGVRSQS